MATLVLKAAGTALGGPVGGWIGAALGAYVDSKVLSSVFAPDNPRPKIGDIQLMTAEEGAPIECVMGPETRTGGEVIWKGAVETIEHGGGDGCGGPSVPSTYGYRASVGIAIGQPPPGSFIEGVEKLFFDGKVEFQEDPDISYTSTLLAAVVDYVTHSTANVVDATNTNPIRVTVDFPIGTNYVVRVLISGVTGNTAANGEWVTQNGTTYSFELVGSSGSGAYTGGGVASRVTRRMKITSPSGGPDLSLFRAGFDVVVSGYANGGNNGSFECISSGKDPVTGISHVILDNASVVAEAAGPTVTLFQDLPQFNRKYVDSVEVHNGAPWQQPDPLMEAELGAGKVSGMPGIAWVALERLNLTAFGDRIPQTNIVTRVSTSWTVGQAIGAILERYGFESAEYDVATLTQACRGYHIRGPATGANCLASIMLTFDVVHYEEDGVLHFVRRKDLVAQTISSNELATRAVGEDAPRKVQLKPVDQRTLPREVDVHFQNPAKDWQGGMEAERGTGNRGDVVQSIETNVTMSAGQGQDTARRIYWTAQANKHVGEIRLPPSRTLLREASLCSVTELGQTWNFLASKITQRKDGVLVIEGPNDISAALDFSGSPADGGAPDSGGPGVLEALDLHILDVAPFSDAHYLTPGTYAVAAPRGMDKVWLAPVLYDSDAPDDGTFSQLAALNRAGTIGIAASALGGGVSAWMIDRKNTIDVELTFGHDLQSYTEAQMLLGKNRILIGGEVLGYATATLLGTTVRSKTWRLSVLLRGLRDTDAEIDRHQNGERVVILGTNEGLQFIQHPSSLIGSDRFFRLVPTGGVVDDYPNVLEPLDGNTVRPFSVYDVRGDRLASDATPDVVVTWRRQTRANVLPFSQSAPVLLEAAEAYEVDLMNPAGFTVMLTKSVSGARTVTFTDAEITGAGYSSGDPIKVRIYQMGDFTGRGRVRAATV